MKRYLPLVIVLVSATHAGAPEPCAAPAGADANPAFDASLLREGRFTYHTTLKGESLGDTVIEIRRAQSNYRITMNAPEIAQSWEATVRRSFAPRTAHLKMVARGVPYEMSLRYDGGTVTGEERRGDATTPVRATVNGVVLDQRVDWASVMAVEAKAGSSLAIGVFDPSTGASPMLAMVGATEAMTGAWGAVDAVRLDYRICKGAHVENYTVFASAATPRYMLREDMPNGLTSELIRIEP
jgi:hypothetical protein